MIIQSPELNQALASSRDPYDDYVPSGLVVALEARHMCYDSDAGSTPIDPSTSGNLCDLDESVQRWFQRDNLSRQGFLGMKQFCTIKPVLKLDAKGEPCLYFTGGVASPATAGSCMMMQPQASANPLVRPFTMFMAIDLIAKPNPSYVHSYNQVFQLGNSEKWSVNNGLWRTTTVGSVLGKQIIEFSVPAPGGTVPDEGGTADQGCFRVHYVSSIVSDGPATYGTNSYNQDYTTVGGVDSSTRTAEMNLYGYYVFNNVYPQSTRNFFAKSRMRRFRF